MLEEVIAFVASDGSELIVMPRALYESLVDQPADGERKIPDPVRDAIGRGISPIRAWRRHRGFTQAALADASGVHRITISRLEAGRTGAASVATRLRVAAALDVPLSAI